MHRSQETSQIVEGISCCGGRVYDGKCSPGLVTYIVVPLVCSQDALRSLPHKVCVSVSVEQGIGVRVMTRLEDFCVKVMHFHILRRTVEVLHVH